MAINIQLACLIGLAGMFLTIKEQEQEKKKERKQRRWWIRPIYMPEARRDQGAHANLINEMRLSDPKKFSNWMRMTPATFEKLLKIVGPKITKLHIARTPIDACTKLELTLRYNSKFFKTVI